MKYYAVAVGHTPGIYFSVADARNQTVGYPGGIFKKFRSRAGAALHIQNHCHPARYQNLLQPNTNNVSVVTTSVRENHQYAIHGVSPIVAKDPEELFYAVRKGRIPGVYYSLGDAESQIRGFTGAHYKIFDSKICARRYVDSTLGEPSNQPNTHPARSAHPQTISRSPLAPRQVNGNSVTRPRVSKPLLPPKNESIATKIRNYLPASAGGPSALRTNLPSQVKRSGHSKECILSKSLTMHDCDLIYKVYTDGSCLHNQDSTRASGGIGVYFGPNNPENFSGPLLGSNQTNQRAELAAVLTALRIIALRPYQASYCIITDSEYAIKSVDERHSAVANGDILDDIQAAKLLLQSLGSTWKLEHVNSNSYERHNDMADFLAKQGVPVKHGNLSRSSRHTFVSAPSGEYRLPSFVPDRGHTRAVLDAHSNSTQEEQEFLHVYVSGLCSNKKASFGVFFGFDHPDNYCNALMGEIQSLERAQLAGILHALWLIARRQFSGKYFIFFDCSYAKKIMPLIRKINLDKTTVAYRDILRPMQRLVADLDRRRIALRFRNRNYELHDLDDQCEVAEAQKLALWGNNQYHVHKWGCDVL